MIKANPFDECPVYETDNFIFTKIKPEDAEDLFEVYSDLTTRQHMNNDNCGGEWPCDSLEIMEQGIKSWEQEYQDKFYIRWTVTQKHTMKHIGTIELAPAPSVTRFFDGVCDTGILRVDIKSELETESVFTEIYSMTRNEMIEDFGIIKIITKGLGHDDQRIQGLNNSAYHRMNDYEIISYPDYYFVSKW